MSYTDPVLGFRATPIQEGPHLISFTPSQLQRTFVQTRPGSQVPGVRTWTALWGAVIQPHTGGGQRIPVYQGDRLFPAVAFQSPGTVVSHAVVGGSPEPALSCCPAVGRPSPAEDTLSLSQPSLTLSFTEPRWALQLLPPTTGAPLPFSTLNPGKHTSMSADHAVPHALFLGTPCWSRGWGKAPTMNQHSASERSSVLRGWASEGSNKALLTKKRWWNRYQ